MEELKKEIKELLKRKFEWQFSILIHNLNKAKNVDDLEKLKHMLEFGNKLIEEKLPSDEISEEPALLDFLEGIAEISDLICQSAEGLMEFPKNK